MSNSRFDRLEWHFHRKRSKVREARTQITKHPCDWQQDGFDPVYGARPLRRYIARQVETPIARALIAGNVRDGAEIKIGLTDGKLTIGYDNPA